MLPFVMLHPATIDSFLSLKAIRPGVLTGVFGVAKLLPVYKIFKKKKNMYTIRVPFFVLREKKKFFFLNRFLTLFVKQECFQKQENVT